jgi:hypothetical protein
VVVGSIPAQGPLFLIAFRSNPVGFDIFFASFAQFQGGTSLCYRPPFKLTADQASTVAVVQASQVVDLSSILAALSTTTAMDSSIT